jgi:hypothetical protein
MRKEKEDRVLGRLGARELTPEEVERATGGERNAHRTDVITLNVITGHLDGDGAP